MKKVLLSALISCFILGVSAQTYFSEDFSGGLGQFTSTDSDGDTYEWMAYDFGDGQGNVATSASWDANVGPLTPDNWLISSAIDLSSASGNIGLEWLVMAQDQAWADENYTVYVATANTTAALSASSTSFNEVIGTSTGYMSRYLDVSSFAGQTIYVGFRHHNCTDWFMMNIDDVMVRTVLSDDAGISDITTSGINLLSSGAISCSGVITNYGSSTITSVDVSWSIDGGTTMTENLTGLNIAAGATHNFTHADQWTPTGTGCSDLQVWTSNVNGNTDPISSNDSKTEKVSVVDQTIAKLPIYENFTSNTCGPCASFNPGFQTLIDANNVNDGLNAGVANVKYQMDWPGAADQSFNADGNTRRTFYGVSGIPDHYINGEAGNASQSEIDAHKTGLSGLGLSSVATWTGNDVVVDVTVNPIACYGSTDLKLFIAVTEDVYTNTAGSNGETTFHQVMRKMLPDGNGTSLGALTAGTAVNVSESYAFTVGNVAANGYNLWVGPTNTTVVVFVQDMGTGEVINSGIAVNGCGTSGPSATAVGGVGSADLTVTGGTAPYTYAWSNGATTEDLSGVASGTYTCVVTDASGCQTVASVTVAGALAATTTSTGVSASGLCDATATVTVTGGVAPYFYLWSTIPAQTTASASNLCEGTYTCVITDSDGSTVTASVTVTDVPTGLENNDLEVLTSVYPNPFTGATNVDFTLTETSNVSMQLINVVGEVVMSSKEQTYTAGSYNERIDFSGFDAGVYFIDVKVNGVSNTIKAIYQK